MNSLGKNVAVEVRLALQDVIAVIAVLRPAVGLLKLPPEVRADGAVIADLSVKYECCLVRYSFVFLCDVES